MRPTWSSRPTSPWWRAACSTSWAWPRAPSPTRVASWPRRRRRAAPAPASRSRTAATTAVPTASSGRPAGAAARFRPTRSSRASEPRRPGAPTRSCSRASTWAATAGSATVPPSCAFRGCSTSSWRRPTWSACASRPSSPPTSRPSSAMPWRVGGSASPPSCTCACSPAPTAPCAAWRASTGPTSSGARWKRRAPSCRALPWAPTSSWAFRARRTRTLQTPWPSARRCALPRCTSSATPAVPGRLPRTSPTRLTPMSWPPAARGCASLRARCVAMRRPAWWAWTTS